jgi:hypothetical protein
MNTGSDRRRFATASEVQQALHALDRALTIISAADFPGELRDLDQPGLYAWWADATGAAMLTAGLEHDIAAGRIYAGLTGATKWPSGATGRQTLRTRIGRNHIRGRIRGSTFRLTLAGILAPQLGLRLVRPAVLEPDAERALTTWIKERLSVAVHPFADPDPLGDLEHRVLARLSPPLNIDAMTSNELRRKLSELRGRMRRLDGS